ncbi:MAG: twin-arginine translocation signal domain-containing protein [Candidatus Omnitrophica bacterium]|nr:twin-arginine translocation signal domain-containing protein [Candidatus Omnitrophota bacterium]
MKRRDFLKFCALGIAGIFLARVTKLFSFGEKLDHSLKEASFYRQADDLAG